MDAVVMETTTLHRAQCSNVYRRLPRLADGREGITRAFLFGNPFLFVLDDVEQQPFVVRRRHEFPEMLVVRLIVERFPGLRVELLSRPAPDVAIEPDVRRI